MRTATPEGTKDKIREAADELFCRVGYDGVSVRDIAERAGVNKALVFYHFESKTELFERILERYYDAHQKALADAFGAEGTARERIHRMLDAYFDFMAKNVRYAVLVQQQLSNPETHPLIEKNLQPLYRWIERALGEVVPAAARSGKSSARQLYVTFSGLVINYFTYAPMLGRVWEGDPLGEAMLDERRSHVHWLVDLMLDDLERTAKVSRLRRDRRSARSRTTRRRARTTRRNSARNQRSHARHRLDRAALGRSASGVRACVRR